MIDGRHTCEDCVHCCTAYHRKWWESSMAYCTKDKNKWWLTGRRNTPCPDFDRRKSI